MGEFACSPGFCSTIDQILGFFGGFLVFRAAPPPHQLRLAQLAQWIAQAAISRKEPGGPRRQTGSTGTSGRPRGLALHKCTNSVVQGPTTGGAAPPPYGRGQCGAIGDVILASEGSRMLKSWKDTFS